MLAHFDAIAQKYDQFKQQKPYYYGAILRSLRKHIFPKDFLLDYGCGTGTLLATLNPRKGVGYDPSKQMIKVAKNKYAQKKNLTFTTTLEDFHSKFDVVMMVDVIEHLADVPQAIGEIRGLLKPNSRVVVSYVDGLWEWVLMAMEILHLKMPEGPHNRISTKSFIELAEKQKLTCVSYHHEKILTLLPFRPLTILVFQNCS